MRGKVEEIGSFCKRLNNATGDDEKSLLISRLVADEKDRILSNLQRRYLEFRFAKDIETERDGRCKCPSELIETIIRLNNKPDSDHNREWASKWASKRRRWCDYANIKLNDRDSPLGRGILAMIPSSDSESWSNLTAITKAGRKALVEALAPHKEYVYELCETAHSSSHLLEILTRVARQNRRKPHSVIGGKHP